MNQDSLLFSFSISLLGLALLIINTFLFVSKLKGKDKLYKIFTCYLIFLTIEEIACNVIGFTQIISNTFLSHFHFQILLFFLSVLYYNLFSNKSLKKLVLIIYVLIFLGLGIQYFNNPNLFWQFNVPEIVIISIVLICYALIHLYNCISEQKKYFHFSIGISLFLLCASIIYMSGQYELVFWRNPLIDIWIFSSLFFIVLQVFIFKEWKKQIK
jgi:hypothetical protein